MGQIDGGVTATLRRDDSNFSQTEFYFAFRAGADNFQQPSGVMAGLVPAIHVFCYTNRKTWMPGTRPGMTRNYFAFGSTAGSTLVPSI